MPAEGLYNCMVDRLRRASLPKHLSADARKMQMSKWRGVRAELYQLNVYNGPSGRFKPHVDTPRSDIQIGSLVVCLPVAFEGGALAVRHQGWQVVHDWSSDAMRKSGTRFLQRAAFHSDCEHKVLPVTDGSRVTLTYNLYLSAGTGMLTGHEPRLQPATLHVLSQLKKTLQNGTFLPNGGYLGYYLVHSYPHTNGTLLQLVPNMLKGADLAIYEALRAANLTCVLEPISHYDANGKYLTLLEGLKSKDRQTRSEVGTPLSGLKGVDVDQAFVEENVLEEDFNDPDEDEHVPCDLERITWVNTAYEKNEELSMARVTYGNNAELTVRYSRVALIAEMAEWTVARDS